MHIEAEGMTQFDIFLFSELKALLNQQKSEIYPKMPMFEQLKKQVPVNSKQF